MGELEACSSFIPADQKMLKCFQGYFLNTSQQWRLEVSWINSHGVPITFNWSSSPFMTIISWQTSNFWDLTYFRESEREREWEREREREIITFCSTWYLFPSKFWIKWDRHLEERKKFCFFQSWSSSSSCHFLASNSSTDFDLVWLDCILWQLLIGNWIREKIPQQELPTLLWSKTVVAI